MIQFFELYHQQINVNMILFKKSVYTNITCTVFFKFNFHSFTYSLRFHNVSGSSRMFLFHFRIVQFKMKSISGQNDVYIMLINVYEVIIKRIILYYCVTTKNANLSTVFIFFVIKTIKYVWSGPKTKMWVVINVFRSSGNTISSAPLVMDIFMNREKNVLAIVTTTIQVFSLTSC